MHFVYHLLDSGLVQYVGRTVNPTQRQREHERKHDRTFTMHLALATADIQEAMSREQADILRYEPPLNFSETSSPGRLGKPHSEETKALISAANTGRVRSEAWREKLAAANRGRTMSPEARAKISQANMGRVISPEAIAKQKATRAANAKPVSEETKAKMRAAWAAKKARGYVNPNPMKGKKHSEETRAKMRESQAKRPDR